MMSLPVTRVAYLKEEVLMPAATPVAKKNFSQFYLLHLPEQH